MRRLAKSHSTQTKLLPKKPTSATSPKERKNIPFTVVDKPQYSVEKFQILPWKAFVGKYVNAATRSGVGRCFALTFKIDVTIDVFHVCKAVVDILH